MHFIKKVDIKYWLLNKKSWGCNYLYCSSKVQCHQLWTQFYGFFNSFEIGNTIALYLATLIVNKKIFLHKHTEFATKASSMDSFEYPWSGSIRPRAIHRPVIDWRSSPMQRRAFLAHVHVFFYFSDHAFIVSFVYRVVQCTKSKQSQSSQLWFETL